VIGSIIGPSTNALWWSLLTVTTVGYGDFTPVTTVGRVMATVLMIGGIWFFSGLAANFAAILIHTRATITELDVKIEALSRQIETFTQKLNGA